LERVVSALFVEAMAQLAGIPDGRCSEPWQWPGRSGWPLQVRDALYRSLEDELAAVAAQPPPPAESARLLAAGQRAWGELRGLLVGLPDRLLDERPTGGESAEWTLRQVLNHVLLVERRYREQVAYALRRSDEDPLRSEPSAAVLPAEEEGGMRDWIDRLARQREAAAAFAELTAGQLLRAAVWAGYDVDVRFRLLRFAGHLVEHTVQAEKLLASAGHRIGEAHLIVRRISAARGAHELSTSPEELARLDAAHAERARSLG
jgi:uncharacterized damage-inducible protein DinB